ncbi:MAG: alanine--tRNA ligase-related protein, partial [Candidatus Bathyarchaeia archaeon]
MQVGENEFAIPFFLSNGFTRKRCASCGSYYWTQDSESRDCGDAPCHIYTFIGSPPTRGSYSVSDMRRKFIRFFEKNGHTPIDPYPVIARWRDDVYLVGASIFDFQPYVTDGVLPPPANPLVVSQPCLRFTDLDNVGPTAGRHLVIFEMGGAHAFNYPDREIYWKDETIRYHHELLTGELGVKSEAVNYKEHFWSGGGNAGPDVEACVAGLEISTLVFMSYKTSNGSLIEMPIKTVDTGYGIERWAWLSQGSPSGFHAIYPELIDILVRQAGVSEDKRLIAEATKLSGAMNFETVKDRVEAKRAIAAKIGLTYEQLESLLRPMEHIYAVADHTKALAFMLSEAVTPSNVEEGYLARLLIRRCLRTLKLLGLEGRLPEIMSLQIDKWSRDFPRLREMRS